MFKTRHTTFVLLIIILASVVPIAQAQDDEITFPYLIVNTTALNVRTGPGVEYDSVGTVRGGDRFNIDGKSPDHIWFYVVDTPFGDGWVRGRYTIFRGDIDGVPVIDGPFGELEESFFYVSIRVPVYNELGGEEVGLVGGGQTYLVVAREYNGNWLQIDTAEYGVVWIQFISGAFQGVWRNVPIVQETIPIFGEVTNYLVVNTYGLNVRTGPGTEYAALGSVRGGAEYVVDGISPDSIWFYILDTPYGDGWVRGRYTLFRGELDAVPVITGPYGELDVPTFYLAIYQPVYDKPDGVQLGLVPGRREYVVIGRNFDGVWIQLETEEFGEVWTQYSRGYVRGEYFNVPIILPPYE